jgi:hypothetical protein
MGADQTGQEAQKCTNVGAKDVCGFHAQSAYLEEIILLK